MVIRLDKRNILMHVICVSVLLEAFLTVPFMVGSFKFEWPYFVSCLLLIDVFIQKNERKFDSICNSLYRFFGWCFFLLILAFFRFQSSLLFTGVAHTGRMVLMFSVFIWILNAIDDNARMHLYRVFRIYSIIFCLILFFQGIKSGGIANISSFASVGINKNSLGYSVVCISLFFCAFETKDNVRKCIPVYIWWPICFCVCLFTKSGTAVAFSLVVAAITLYKRLNVKPVLKILITIFVLIVALMFVNIDFLISLFEKLSVEKLSTFLHSFKYGGGTTLGSTTDLRISTQLGVLQEFNLDMAFGRFYYYYFAIYGYTAHSLYLQLLYDIGILGLFLFIRFCFLNVKHSENKLEILAMLAYSLIEVFLIQYTSLIVLAILVTMHRRETDTLPSDKTLRSEYWKRT